MLTSHQRTMALVSRKINQKINRASFDLLLASTAPSRPIPSTCWLDPKPIPLFSNPFRLRRQTSLFNARPHIWLGYGFQTKVPPVVEDYRRLVMSARRRGLFKPAVRIYCLQIALLMGILTASLSLLYIAAPTSNLGLLAGGALMGLFFQHAGGMLHDFMHHSFTPRKWSPWAIWFISNICQVKHHDRHGSKFNELA